MGRVLTSRELQCKCSGLTARLNVPRYGKGIESTGCVLCQVPQETDSEMEFSIQKMY